MISKLKQLLKSRPSDQLIKLIPILNLMIGNYITVTESKLINSLLRVYCLSVFISVIHGYIQYINTTITFSLTFHIVEYITVFIAQFINGENCLKIFVTTLQTYDRIKGYSKIPLFDYNTWIIIAFILIFRITGFILRLGSNTIDKVEICEMTLMLLSMDLNLLTISVVYMICYGRLKLLRKSMERNDVGINIAMRDSVEQTIRNIKTNVRYYCHLLDSVQKIDKHLQLLLFTHWVSHVTKMFCILNDFIKSFLLSMDYFKLFRILEVLHCIFLVFGPAVIMEAITSEMNQIKTTLCAQLLRNTDESIRFELNTTLQYINLRPFKCTICRLLPLNIHLPFAIVGVCITYIIVSLQLTHLSG